MRLIRILSLAGLGVMTVAILIAMSAGEFSTEASAIWALPWGKVTLIDLYVGLAFFGAWVAFRERAIAVTILWWVALLLLGNLAAALYVAIASFTSSSPRELAEGKKS